MNTIILYYTFGGATKKEAERLAAELEAPLYRVREVHNRFFLAAFIPGGMMARRRKAAAIRPLTVDLSAYDRIIIGCPIWAAYPAPAFNALVRLLPANKEVELFFCSGSGEAYPSEPGTKELVERQGCRVVSYRNVRTGVAPNKLKE